MCCFDNICVYHSYSCFEGCFILKGRRRVFNLRWLQLNLDGIVSFTTFCNLRETIPFLLWGLLRERDSLLQKIDGFIYGRKDKVIILWQNIIGNSKALCFSIPSSYQAWICWFVCLFNFLCVFFTPTSNKEENIFTLRHVLEDMFFSGYSCALRESPAHQHCWPPVQPVPLPGLPQQRVFSQFKHQKFPNLDHFYGFERPPLQ